MDGFEGKKVVIQFIYDVENFHVDDKRLSVEPSNGVGNTFTISGLSGTYLEEVWGNSVRAESLLLVVLLGSFLKISTLVQIQLLLMK